MNPLLDNTDDKDYVRQSLSSSGSGREINLGTTMVLLIFFALAVYGATLFGFGYAMGSKRSGSGTSALAAAPIVTPASNASKPAPGSPAKISAKAPVHDETPAPEPPAEAVRTVNLPVDSAENQQSAPSSAARPPITSSASVASTTPAGAPTMVVQVAAVSHKEDADLIASTLQRRGYAVNINNEADKLLHIQVGPFTNRKDAEAMRARLLADGFNAYIK